MCCSHADGQLQAQLRSYSLIKSVSHTEYHPGFLYLCIYFSNDTKYCEFVTAVNFHNLVNSDTQCDSVAYGCDNARYDSAVTVYNS